MGCSWTFAKLSRNFCVLHYTYMLSQCASESTLTLWLYIINIHMQMCSYILTELTNFWENSVYIMCDLNLSISVPDKVFVSDHPCEDCLLETCVHPEQCFATTVLHNVIRGFARNRGINVRMKVFRCHKIFKYPSKYCRNFCLAVGKTLCSHTLDNPTFTSPITQNHL